MRLWVRPGVRINHSTGFSRIVGSAPERTQSMRLYQHQIPIAGQPDSRDQMAVNKKRQLFPELPQTSPASFVLPLNIHDLAAEF